MNDKKFISTNIKKSLGNLLIKCGFEGHELRRFDTLCSLVSSVLITGNSTLHHLALGNPDLKQYESKKRQYKR